MLLHISYNNIPLEQVIEHLLTCTLTKTAVHKPHLLLQAVRTEEIELPYKKLLAGVHIQNLIIAIWNKYQNPIDTNKTKLYAEQQKIVKSDYCIR